ncbi:hypothetical protein C8Q74DRAFT_1450957 [Fomes fomentarius]|nr:hypothetical protein C8Q74DRAFT_1450957 [Fomes fomentarius]
MPPPLDREMLKSMKRADLQRICKDYGIKANLKTEALIDLLVDTTQAARPTPPPPPQRAPSTRLASRSGTGTRFRGASTSSVIIHDTDEESALTEDLGTDVPSAPPSEPEVLAVPPPRTRRAKDTQYKLGVGRPIVAGGSGARSVTRSGSLSQKGKRGKGSKSVKPTEAAIQEEEEPDPMQSDMPEAGPSGITHEPLASAPPHPAAQTPIPDPLAEAVVMPVHPLDTSAHLKTWITNLVAPLQTQVQMLQAEAQQRSTQAADLTTLAAQVRSLQTEVASLRPLAALVPQLQAEVNHLKQFIAILTQAPGVAPSEKSLGKARAVDEGSPGTPIGAVQFSHATPTMLQGQGFPGIAPSTLGKRHRDLDDSHVTDVVDVGEEGNHNQEDLEKRVVRPTKKRQKLSAHDDLGPSSSVDPGPEEPPEAYIDPPPPTTHLSDLFPFGSDTGQITPPNAVGGAIPRPPGADENASNQFPPNFNFNFNASMFDPVTSTPFDINLPPFTYPEPPASPSPAAPSGGFVERAGGRIERNDLFQPLRRMTPAALSRPQSAVDRATSRTPVHAGLAQSQSPAASSATVDPSMLMATPPRLSSVPEAPQEAEVSVAMANGLSSSFLGLSKRTVSSTEIGMQLGMSSAMPLPPETPGGPMKRTMYGTELEGDTRFGDFGVEGVASGFWAGISRRM